uniref:Uncharacterized protein n=1 Tax=Timema tahoe TaxID=61484 RepID=A0A7R9IAI9_9NEOP|nr:unnamed protein product [Timema tahoe]
MGSTDKGDIRKQFNQKLRPTFAWLQFVFYPLPGKRSAPIHFVSSVWSAIFLLRPGYPPTSQLGNKLKPFHSKMMKDKFIK